jgi:hypothetical protein
MFISSLDNKNTAKGQKKRESSPEYLATLYRRNIL